MIFVSSIYVSGFEMSSTRILHGTDTCSAAFVVSEEPGAENVRLGGGERARILSASSSLRGNRATAAFPSRRTLVFPQTAPLSAWPASLCPRRRDTMEKAQQTDKISLVICERTKITQWKSNLLASLHMKVFKSRNPYNVML